MKNSLIIFIVAVVSTACEQDGPLGPSRLLYQRWQWIESRRADGTVYRPSQNQLTIVTFKPSGEYVNEFNGRQYTCCQPNHFTRQGNQLLFSTVAGGYSSPECIYSSCVSYQPEKMIDSLSAQRLVLCVKDNAGQLVYQAVRWTKSSKCHLASRLQYNLN